MLQAPGTKSSANSCPLLAAAGLRAGLPSVVAGCCCCCCCSCSCIALSAQDTLLRRVVGLADPGDVAPAAAVRPGGLASHAAAAAACCASAAAAAASCCSDSCSVLLITPLQGPTRDPMLATAALCPIDAGSDTAGDPGTARQAAAALGEAGAEDAASLTFVAAAWAAAAAPLLLALRLPGLPTGNGTCGMSAGLCTGLLRPSSESWAASCMPASASACACCHCCCRGSGMCAACQLLAEPGLVGMREPQCSRDFL